MSRTLKRIVLVAVGLVVAVVGATAVWVVFFQEDAPPPPSLDAVDGGTDTTADGDSPEGIWTVVANPDTYGGYRIDETFSGVSTPVEPAVARSGQVTGTVTIEGSTVSAATFSVDLTTLASDPCNVPPGVNLTCDRRDELMKTSGLETNSFPEATFTLTEPIELDPVPDIGAAVEVDAVGTLELHGVTQTVTFPMQARWDGSQLVVVGSLEIALADYAITPPDLPFLSVEDTGTIEVSMILQRP